MRALAICFVSSLMLVSCLNKAEIGEGKDVNPESIFYDYRIWAEEESPNVTVMLQYRFGGEEGTTLVLEEPSKVSLDGMPLRFDSAKLTGAFYEHVRPIEDFVGRHTIEFTDNKAEIHKETFQFLPFSLKEEIPETIKMQPFSINLKDFPAEPTKIRLVMIDTAFDSPDVNEEMMVRNGLIPVSQKFLSRLVEGPITMEIYREEETPLKNASKEGGRLLMTYGLRRQFAFAE